MERTTYYQPKDLKNFANISKWDGELGDAFFKYYGKVFAEGALTDRKSVV